MNLTQITIISTAMGKNPLEEMDWSSWSTEESEMQYLDAISKIREWSLFISKANPFNITVTQVYAQTTNAEEAEQFYKSLQDFLEPTPKNRCPFIIGIEI